jgi:hypothetical protein
MSDRPRRSKPSDEGPNDLSPTIETESNESFASIGPELVRLESANGQSTSAKPWSRVEERLLRDFAREKKAGKLSFERKVELYGEKFEELFRELEERLLCKEEELLIKGRELQRKYFLCVLLVACISMRIDFFWLSILPLTLFSVQF